MINANELRIGNYLQDVVSGELFRVFSIDESNNNAIRCKIIDISKLPLPDGWTIHPIPLTPEILEKCGFAIISNPNHTDSFLCYTPFLKLVLDVKSKKIVLRDYSGIQQSIEHLHQLQNLYFALTGEELQYTT